MDLETMDIELFLEQHPWESPIEPNADELLDSVSFDLNPLNFGQPLDEDFFVGQSIQSLQDGPESVPSLDAVVFQPEHNGVFEEFSPEPPMALGGTTIGSAASVSLPSPTKPPTFPENETQPSSQGSILTQTSQDRDVTQTVQDHGLQDIPNFHQSPSQSTYDISQGNVFDAGTNPEYEQATPEHFMPQAVHELDYGNVSQFESITPIQSNPLEFLDNLITSSFVPSTFPGVTANAEMSLLEPTEINNAHSGTEDHLSPQQLAIHNTAEDTQGKLSGTKILESYNVEGFVYSKVWIQNPEGCPFCEKTFADMSYLCEHIKRSHKKQSQRTIRCPLCNLTMMNETNLLRHIRTSHRQEKIVEVCAICNARFSSRYAAATHRRTVHGIRTGTSQRRSEKKKNIFFKCHTCGSYAKEKGNMKRHVDIVHLERRIYPCKCGIIFKTKHNLHCHKSSKSCLRKKA